MAWAIDSTCAQPGWFVAEDSLDDQLLLCGAGPEVPLGRGHVGVAKQLADLLGIGAALAEPDGVGVAR
jgi:hypothetical protein